MNLTVNMDKKSIQTDPIKRLMIQGEALADIVSFTLPLEYGDIDLSALSYSIRGTSEESETTVTQVLSKSVTGTAVNLEWVISSAFTAIPGELKLILIGSDEAGDTIIKCDGESVYVRADPSVAGFAVASANAYEQLVAQINYQIAHLQVIRILGTYATLSALEAAVASPSNGDMYNVGSSAPYTVYVWTGSWVSLGQLKGDTGDPGTNGTNGTDGVGVPTGGTTNQILYKTSGADHATGWKTLTAGDAGAQPAMTAGVDYVDPTAASQIASCGIASGGAVTAQGTPNQTVAVSAGSIITPEGKRYPISAVSSLAAAAADAIYTRIDIVYVTNAGVVTYLAGTAAATPSQPATPANGTILAAITRAANDNTIATSDIGDRRVFILLASDFVDVYAVTESSNTFACDLAFKRARCLSFPITNTTAKTVTFSNVPYGACDILLNIKATATASVTWTLDGRTVVWPSGAPALTSGSTYDILLSFCPANGKWIGRAQAGAAN
jgi:hypothetical protein